MIAIKLTAKRRHLHSKPITSLVKTKVGILGAGISGLSLAHNLKQFIPPQNITVFDISPKTGGLMRPTMIGQNKEFFFETGPRSFMFHHGQETYKLIQELGLGEHIIKPKTKRLLIYRDGKFHDFKKSILLMFYMSFKHLIKPTKYYQSDIEDDSLANFIDNIFPNKRRAADFKIRLLGVFAGDAEKLSAKLCLPELWEGAKHSKVPWFHDLKSDKTKYQAKIPFFYSLEKGVGQLAGRLEETLRGDGVRFRMNVGDIRVKVSNGSPVVICHNPDKKGFSRFKFDRLASTVSYGGLTDIFSRSPDMENQRSILDALNAFDSKPIFVTNLALHGRDVLKPHLRNAYGFLTPADPQKAALIGVTFDSAVFPQHNGDGPLTRLTALSTRLSPGESPAFDESFKAKNLSEVLRFVHENVVDLEGGDFSAIEMAKFDFPQYYLGFEGRLARLSEALEPFAGRFLLGGWNFGKISVNGCVENSVRLSAQIKQSLMQ